ncbi:MAG: VWA domain-containing protein [Elusimicrobiota bacterium]
MLVDASGSMGLRVPPRAAKWEHGCRLAMAMSYLVLSQGDAAGLVTFDADIRDFIAPRQSLSHLELMDEALDKAVPGGETDLGGTLARVVGSIPRRSLIILVSDLLGDAGRILETVRAFRARKHRILVLQVLDPLERDLDIDGPVRFTALEDGGELRCEVALLRRAYQEAFTRQQRLYQASFQGSGVYYDTFYTDEPWDKGLTRFLALQNTLG